MSIRGEQRLRRGPRYLLAADNEAVLVGGNLDRFTRLETPLEQHGRQRILQFPLNHPLQRARAVDRIVARFGEPFLGMPVELDLQLAIRKQRIQPRGVEGEIQLTDGIASLLRREKVFAYRYEGKRYDCGSKEGFLEANVELALAHPVLGPGFRNFLKTLPL